MLRYLSRDGGVHTLRYSRGRHAGRYIHCRYSIEHLNELTAYVKVFYSTVPRPLWLALGNMRPEPADRASALTGRPPSNSMNLISQARSGFCPVS